MTDYVAAGDYKLLSMEIVDVFGNKRSDKGPVDIKFLVHRFVINESIRFNAITGSVHVLDGIGLFYNFPLRAEEVLQIEFEDWYGNRRKEKFMVHAITNFRPASSTDNSILEYQLELVSWAGWIAATHAIRRAYNDQISMMVEQVYKDFFLRGPRMPDGTVVDGSEKDLVIEETTGQQQLIVPFYNGLETMNFFARNAYGNETSTFQFFEREDGFYFCTDEYLMKVSQEKAKDIPEFSFQNSADLDAGLGDAVKMKGLIHFSFDRPFDTLSHLQEGTYYKQLREVDAQQRRVDVTDYQYYDNIDKYHTFLMDGANLKPSNTRDFVQTFFKQGKRFLTIKDYPSQGQPSAPMVREQPFRNESIMGSWAINQHNNANAIKVAIYGRTSLRPGDQCKIELPRIMEAGGDVKPDTERSGYYLVETISNVFEGDQYVQELTLIRGGIIR